MDARAIRLKDLSPREGAALPWGLAELAGRLVEISGAGAAAPLTAAFGVVLDAQKEGEPAAWITPASSSFYPPDAAASGVDLESLAVVRVADGSASARAAAQLLRSGGFGLLVIDLGPRSSNSSYGRLPAPLLSRLAGLAQKHDAAVVILAEKPAEATSLGSLISLRAEAVRAGEAIQVTVIKDKRRGPGRTYREACRGPAGLC